jgi:hypothetical protein
MALPEVGSEEWGWRRLTLDSADAEVCRAMASGWNLTVIYYRKTNMCLWGHQYDGGEVIHGYVDGSDIEAVCRMVESKVRELTTSAQEE